MPVHLSSLQGTSSGGTTQGPSGPTGESTAVTTFDIWSDGSHIYGFKLHWGTTNVLYGSNSNGTKATITLASNEYVCAIYVDIDGTGILQGFSCDSNLNTGIISCGYTGNGLSTVFSGTGYKWTDMIVYNASGQVEGAQFYYTTPSFFVSPFEIALPALGVMAHVAVVGTSLKKVGKLRDQLSIQAPSCDPPQGTDPKQAQLWYRTFRAQENCKESFLVTFPTILVASVFGYEIFGKWATRAVGALSLVSAFYRYQYMLAYIDDASKRSTPFYCSALTMKPVFYLAVVSCGYLVGKEVYHRVSHQLRPTKVENEKQ